MVYMDCVTKNSYVLTGRGGHGYAPGNRVNWVGQWCKGTLPMRQGQQKEGLSLFGQGELFRGDLPHRYPSWQIIGQACGHISSRNR